MSLPSAFWHLDVVDVVVVVGGGGRGEFHSWPK